jgi:catechol 2,3-dioxygenase-like lactoylglutathione lyase family enzyme
MEKTAAFYKEVLGLRRVGTGTEPYVFDADGTFLVVMKGKLEQPKSPAKRWPMFALSVPDLDLAVEALRDAGVELPWGIEEFGSPEPSSRYVMFRDPAGNLIEVVEWL